MATSIRKQDNEFLRCSVDVVTGHVSDLIKCALTETQLLSGAFMEKITVAEARRVEAIGKQVKLQGWVRTRRDSRAGSVSSN